MSSSAVSMFYTESLIGFILLGRNYCAYCIFLKEAVPYFTLEDRFC